MSDTQIQIQTFHCFEIRYKDKVINTQESRSHKAWQLFAYLLYSGEKPVMQSELISVIWKDTDVSVSVLKTTLHRLRTMLKSLDESLGSNLIQCKNGLYFLNPDYSIQCDFKDFETLFKSAADIPDDVEKLRIYQKAFSLYQGDFLSKYTDEPWIAPISIYFHNLYLNVVCSLLDIYEKKQMYNEAITDLRQASRIEKYEETIYIHLIKTLIQAEHYQDAISVYKYLSEIMQTNLGLEPSSEAKNLFYKATSALSSNIVAIEDLPALIFDNTLDSGATFCDFEFFKQIYLAYSKGIKRNLSVIHVILVNITDMHGHLLSKRSLTCCVNNLKPFLRSSLRSGDVISMCTPSQFVILLPHASAENAENVMERIKTGFFQKYPHSPAKFTHFIQPVIGIDG